MDKEYIIGQLEKKLGDKDYYLRAGKDVKAGAVTSMNVLLRELEMHELEDDEKPIIKRSFKFLDMLRRFLK